LDLASRQGTLFFSFADTDSEKRDATQKDQMEGKDFRQTVQKKEKDPRRNHFFDNLPIPLLLQESSWV